MTRAEIKQNRRMRGALFCTFVTIFVVIVAGTIATVFLDFGTPTPQERAILFKIFIGEVGVAVLALFKILFGIKKKPAKEEKPVPRVAGKYKYEITTSDNKTVYMGECMVKQDGRALVFNGEQQRECSGFKKRRVANHWFSHWAELCSDGRVRLDYTLSNNNGGLRGYATVQLHKKSSERMTGEFHYLQEPYIYGTLKFKRI